MSKNNNNKDNNIIKKVRKEKGYAQILNELINNRELSYKALGMLTYILSKPDDWEVYMGDLIRENVDGEKSVRSGLNELIEHKYVQRYRVYSKHNGKVHHWETLVSEIPFSDDELISSVKETYVLDSEGEIMNQKIVHGTFERYTPIVAEREVTLVSQKGKIEKNKEEITTFPKPTSSKTTSRKRRTTNTNNTNTDLTKTDISSSSKGNTPDSVHPLIQLFNGSICELKKTTTVKFMYYVQNYDKEFIENVIAYCEERNAKSFAYFEKTIKKYIDEGCTTVEKMNQSIEYFQNENKAKKNKALKAKDEKQQEEKFDDYITDRMLDDMLPEEEVVKVDLFGEDLNSIKEIIKPNLNSVSFNTWISSIDFRFDNGTVVAGCPNGFTKNIVESRYKESILDALVVAGIEAELKLVVVA